MPSNAAFVNKKNAILSSLSEPEASYTDASPKGSIDEPIREFIAVINGYDDLVTTSSCSGRISVFLEGSGSGGKGAVNGLDDADKGRWLFVSHDPIDSPDSSVDDGPWHSLFSLRACEAKIKSSTTAMQPSRFVHFKFEPMILHILCASARAADAVLKCAQQAGFRESGASNVPTGDDAVVHVAIRTAGLSFDNVIGYGLPSLKRDGLIPDQLDCNSLVTEDYISMLVCIANERFKTNLMRQQRLQQLLNDKFGKNAEEDWEDADDRRKRKRAEGLRRREAMKADRDPAYETEGTCDSETSMHLDGLT